MLGLQTQPMHKRKMNRHQLQVTTSGSDRNEERELSLQGPLIHKVIQFSCHMHYIKFVISAYLTAQSSKIPIKYSNNS